MRVPAGLCCFCFLHQPNASMPSSSGCLSLLLGSVLGGVAVKPRTVHFLPGDTRQPIRPQPCPPVNQEFNLISQINAECLFCCEFICNFCWFRFCVMDLSLSFSPSIYPSSSRPGRPPKRCSGAGIQESPRLLHPGLPGLLSPNLLSHTGNVFFFSFSFPPPLPLLLFSILFIKPGQESLMSLRTGRLSCKKTNLQKVRFIILN